MAENNKEINLEPIQTVERALQVLEALSERGSMSLNELHRVIKVNKASLLRLVYTLTQTGYLTRNESTKEYTLSMKMFEIGMSAVQSMSKMSIINTVLADLSSATGRIAQFSVEENNALICLQSIGQNTPSFSIYTNVGNRSPLYCTSAGKALLAAHTNMEVMEIWDQMDVKAYTEHTITDVKDLLADLAVVRTRQYALDMEENEINVFCIGAAVLGPDSKPIGAISISGRSMTPEDEAFLSEKLLASVRLLSRMMGYTAAAASMLDFPG